MSKYGWIIGGLAFALAASAHAGQLTLINETGSAAAFSFYTPCPNNHCWYSVPPKNAIDLNVADGTYYIGKVDEKEMFLSMNTDGTYGACARWTGSSLDDQCTMLQSPATITVNPYGLLKWAPKMRQ